MKTGDMVRYRHVISGEDPIGFVTVVGTLADYGHRKVEVLWLNNQGTTWNSADWLVKVEVQNENR